MIETMAFCKMKLERAKKDWSICSSDKRLEGYEKAMLSVMSYLHNRKNETAQPILHTIYPSGLKQYKCPKCKIENITEQDKYCGECGVKLDFTPRTPQNDEVRE